MSRFLIYGLIDPRTLLIRYVGLSSEGLRRPAKHREPASLRERNHKNGWIKNLLAAGFIYEVVVLQTCVARYELPEAEKFWIAYGRCLGWPLTNLTDGGDGWLGKKHTLETRTRLCAINLGKKQSAETIAKRIMKNRGQKRSPETRMKMSAWQVGKRLSNETKAKISAARRRCYAEAA